MAQKRHAQKRVSFIEKLAKYTARILLHFDIKFKTFTNHLRKEYVLAAKKLHPDYTNLQLGIRTGIDRRVVGEITKDPQADLPKEHEKDYIVMQRLYDYCRTYKTNQLSKELGSQSFKQICAITTGAFASADAIAIELMRKGLIKDQGRYYQVIDVNQHQIQDAHQRVMQRFLNCIYSLLKVLESGHLLDKPQHKNNPIIPIQDLKHLENIHPALYGAILSVQEYTLDRFHHILFESNNLRQCNDDSIHS